jgi:perosamine synthetase
MLRLPLNNPEHTWQTFMLVLADNIDRPQLVQRLAEQGIEAGPGAVAGHLGAHFQPQHALPVSDLLAGQGLALPLHAGLDLKDVDFVVDQLCRQLEQCSSAARPKDGPMLAHGRL